MGFRCKSFSLSFIIVSCFPLQFVIAIDTITSTQFVKDSQEITSDNGRFKLGFFCPPNSTNRYIGIWYMSKSIILWVANRNHPLKDSSGIFTISEDGNLVVLSELRKILWSTNVSNIASIASAQLRNSGNLVLKDKKTGVVIWESFQHPSDTFLAQMKFTTNKRTGEKLRLTSWRSPSDPSIGNFSVTLEALNVAEEFIWRQSLPYWRSGPWNGRVFLGIPEMKSVYNNGVNVGEDDGSLFLTYNFGNQSELVIYVLNSQGQLEEVGWNEQKMEYVFKWINAKSECDIYGFCGAYGICDAQSSPICSCLRGYEPRDPGQWNVQNWSRGCVRRTALECEKSNNGTDEATQDGFLIHQMVKVPAFLDWSSITEDLCRIQCLKNCSCTAYAYDTGAGCMYWTRSLIDIQKFSSAGVDLYVRVAYSEIDKEKDVRWIILISALSGACTAVFCAYMFIRTCKHSARQKGRNGTSFPGEQETHAANEINVGELTHAKLPELPVFEFVQIATATNNFHLDNKLGQGGFGSVYKGELQDGQEIAVKRLSRASGQGIEEFMNEVTVISNLQHRNLVRLIGCCIERGEKILIYEYLRNKSLDEFIFDPENQKVLDWTKRFSIIQGIARGLLYLHRDSRLRIIHRDLKASNILLDDELNPKISDFGMARIFGGTQNEVNTRRIVGTYGYMSPEYAMDGLFSEKSDVFSFGVLLLEIISGRRNNSFYNDDRALSLIGYAWKLWKEDNTVSLTSGDIYYPNFLKETLRGIHTALLCVQEQAKDRPNMSTVISMLNGEIASLPPPKQPAFILRQLAEIGVKSSSDANQCSNNNVTMTSIHGR